MGILIFTITLVSLSFIVSHHWVHLEPLNCCPQLSFEVSLCVDDLDEDNLVGEKCNEIVTAVNVLAPKIVLSKQVMNKEHGDQVWWRRRIATNFGLFQLFQRPEWASLLCYII